MDGASWSRMQQVDISHFPAIHARENKNKIYILYNAERYSLYCTQVERVLVLYCNVLPVDILQTIMPTAHYM